MSKWYDNDFQEALHKAMLRYAHGDTESTQRWGQVLYNAFHDARPELVRRVVVTDADPYHDDENIGRFLDFLEKNW